MIANNDVDEAKQMIDQDSNNKNNNNSNRRKIFGREIENIIFRNNARRRIL